MTLKPYPQPHEDEGFNVPEGKFYTYDKSKKASVIRPFKFKYTPTNFVFDNETGRHRFDPVLSKDDKKEEREDCVMPYIPSDDLKQIVQLAQILNRPILIKGEPGSGKTQFAKSVAVEWYGKNYREHFFEWHIKSTSKALDGLATFDHIGRLRDSSGRNKNEREKSANPKNYRKFGPMVKAFITSEPKSPSILLIDEIDKAELDFPNDLLLELDERRFYIPETDEIFDFSNRVIMIFITSNDERELPEAFLRRCLFCYLPFPANDQLIKIIQAHVPDLTKKAEKFVEKLITRFNELREKIQKDPTDNKSISTSELIDWAKAYSHDISEVAKEDLAKRLKEIENVELPKLNKYSNTLLKTERSLIREEKIQNQSDKPTS